jgi:GDPmannose 4,6-dehydratase
MTPQPPKAVITGVTGQDGSYLAENLLAAGFEVWGILRRSSNRNFENIQHLTVGAASHPHFGLAIADLTDPVSIRSVLARVKPDYIYNLAAMSFVGASWEQPVLTFEVNTLGFLNLLEAVRDTCPEAHVYQASTSEMFGNSPGPQNEQTPMIPRSPYGVSKLAAHRMAQVYRASHSLWVTCGILFNHESPRRGMEFVSRKVAHGVVQIAAGKQTHLHLGNLSARRDWGYATDYVQAMRLMMERDIPDDFVIGTGVSHTVWELVELAFELVGIRDWEPHCIGGELLQMRPAEVYNLVADAGKAREVLGWEPTVNFETLVGTMVMAECEREKWYPVRGSCQG